MIHRVRSSKFFFSSLPVSKRHGSGRVLRGCVWGVVTAAWFFGCNTAGPTDDDGAGSGGVAMATGGAGAGSGGAGTGTGGMGGTAGSTGGTGGTGGADVVGPPAFLSQTGLYAADMETLAEGVAEFEPRFALWSDGAAKRRWVQLPEGEQIDTSDMDYWRYPVGTKLWKEFTRDGVRVETRLLEKQPNGGWWMVAYQWREDQSEADAVPEGVEDASGTPHDIPSVQDCEACHTRVPDKVLGFSAIQLAHESDGMGGAGGAEGSSVTLADLEAAGWLSEPPPSDLSLPGTPTDQAALGYLHANCGNCHNPKSSVSGRVNMQLWLTVADLSSVEETPTFQTTVDQAAVLPEGPAAGTHRISPGELAASDVYLRMDSRGEDYSMPALGTELKDDEGLGIVEDWILSLE